MFYYTYEVRFDNPESGLDKHTYYGKHETMNLDDGYIGSGLLLRRYIAKYGKVGITRTILNYYNTREELNEAERILIDEKKQELGDLCCNMHEGGNGGHWVEYVSPEIRESRRARAINCLYEKTTAESRHENAIQGGLGKKVSVQNNPEAWSKICKSVHARRTTAEKEAIYAKVSASLSNYYRTVDVGVLEEKRRKNKETNIKSAAAWRSEFGALFGHTPEYFRPIGMMKEACRLFKKIRNLDKEVQQYEVYRFMESIDSSGK